MEDIIIYAFAVILVMLQVLTCILAKKAWLRWLPFMLNATFILLCFILYQGSNMTNWGYVILIAILSIVMLLQGAILLLNRVIRRITKS